MKVAQSVGKTNDQVQVHMANGMSNVISLATYRRRRAQARFSKAGRHTLRVLGKVAFFLPGSLVSLIFVSLRLVGIVHWNVAWLVLPLLIDLGLWYANARTLFALYKLIGEPPLKPLRGNPAPV